ncbi:MAG TPA: hypothetical protein VMH01_05145 [Puia sp.]|nr:hypothetical protein [Puia sp.]
MKRMIDRKTFQLLFVFLLASGLSGYAQTVKDVFNNSSTTILFLGIDFTKNKVINDLTVNVNDLRDREYGGINDLFLSEPKKYNIKSAYQRSSSVDNDLSLTQKRNEKVNVDDIRSSNSADFHRLKEDDIKALVSGFDFGGKKGVGLIFVMEAMSKSDKAVAIWPTLVDMGSKTMLMTDRVEGKLGMGFGVRNYYATGVHSVIEDIEKKKYKEWKAKYGG